MTVSDEADDRHVRPFAEWLVEQRQGALASELAEALNGLVDAVGTYAKQGTLTLKLTVKPASTNTPMVTVTDNIALSLPEAERPAVIYFVDDDSNLTRANPAQAELPLREVPRPETDEKPKEVSNK
jgi:hypothetical protein